MRLLLFMGLFSAAWLALLAGAAVVHRIAEDVRRWRSWQKRLNENRFPHVGGHKEITDGHA